MLWQIFLYPSGQFLNMMVHFLVVHLTASEYKQGVGKNPQKLKSMILKSFIYFRSSMMHITRSEVGFFRLEDVQKDHHLL